MLLEYLGIAAVALIELHQLLVETILLGLLPFLELGRITWWLLIHVALLTAGDSERLTLILTLGMLISVILSPLRLNRSGFLDGLALACDSIILLIGCCLIPVEELRVGDNLPSMVDCFASEALGIATFSMAALLLIVGSATTVSRLVSDPSLPRSSTMLRPSLIALCH